MGNKAPPTRHESDFVNFVLPIVDENGTPKTKMPNCPRCGEDELGMIQSDVAVCNWCDVTILRKQEEPSA